jgi:hypothetical protein
MNQHELNQLLFEIYPLIQTLAWPVAAVAIVRTLTKAADRWRA